MTRSCAFASLLVLCAAAPTALAGGGGGAGCSQYDEKSGKECCTSDCSPRFPDPAASNTWTNFDFSALCKGNYESVNKCEPQWDPRPPQQPAQKDAHWQKGEQTCNGDWILTDKDGHTYSVSFCSRSYWKCLTATWNTPDFYGNVVQYWGATPTYKFDIEACENAYAKANPRYPGEAKKRLDAFNDTNSPTGMPGCTADCQVLAFGSPEWTLEEYEKGNPNVGKLTALFPGAVPDRTDPFWCPFDPATGREEPRSVEFQFVCDPTVDVFPKAGYVIENSIVAANNGKPQISIAQNSTDECKYKVTVFTPEACSEHTPPADDEVYDDDNADGAPLPAPPRWWWIF